MVENIQNKQDNKLFYGDNLTIMKSMPTNSIDLIYLDPPFNSKKTYNIMYKNMVGEPVDEQVEAFCDSWEMDEEKQDLIDSMQDTMRDYEIAAEFIEFWNYWIKALRVTQLKLLAYLIYMTSRLLEMRRLLKLQGSIYYHCDPTASHYIKVIMDGIFGYSNFRNEITLCYDTGGIPRKDFARKHDVILRYSKESNYYFNKDRVRIRYKEKAKVKYKIVNNKKYSRKNPLGKSPLDWWDDIPPLTNTDRKRIGYPTQKPVKLLDRIIEASCPENGTVLDPFCGCGTTMYSTHENNHEKEIKKIKGRKETILKGKTKNRKWIGIDIASLLVWLGILY